MRRLVVAALQVSSVYHQHVLILMHVRAMEWSKGVEAVTDTCNRTPEYGEVLNRIFGNAYATNSRDDEEKECD